MSKVHNKKRNIGIIYEQVVQYICKNILEKNEENAKKGIEIIKNNFKEGTQLNKEFKLFKALATTNNISDHLATSIIKEAKKACNYHFDNKKLEIEKSNLIKDLNYTFGKGVIFEESIKNYKIYATIQTLLNEWRNNNNFDRITEFEIKLHESLTQKSVLIESNDLDKNIKFDKLTHNLMKKIFDQKYSTHLNENQKTLIHHYTNDNDNELIEHCRNIKESTIKNLDSYIQKCNNSILIKKYESVKQNIFNLNENNINKEQLKKFLTLSKLQNELNGDVL